MKKILALLLALIMLLCLTACGGDDSAQGATEPSHSHSYSSTEKPASCTEKGLETFTCSCGYTYTEEILSTGHAWSGWITEIPALIGKDGTEKQTCAVCMASETRTTDEFAAINSLDDWQLGCFFDGATGHDMYIGKNLVETNLVNSYIDYIFFHQNGGDATTVSAGEYLATAQQYFVLDAAALDRLLYGKGDPVEIGFQNPSYSVYDFLGYTHGGDNIYTVYYERPYGDSEASYFAVEMEYNLLDGQPNRYISIVRITSLPDNIIY